VGFPPGFPLLAVKQSRSHNSSYFRRFDVGFHRILLDQGTKLSALFQAVWDMDLADKEDGDPNSRLNTSVFDVEQLVNEYCPNTHPRMSHCTTCRPQSGLTTQSEGQAEDESNPQEEVAQDRKDRYLKAIFPRLKDYCKCFMNSLILVCV
jgi:hypothetical protein